MNYTFENFTKLSVHVTCVSRYGTVLELLRCVMYFWYCGLHHVFTGAGVAVTVIHATDASQPQTRNAWQSLACSPPGIAV